LDAIKVRLDRIRPELAVVTITIVLFDLFWETNLLGLWRHVSEPEFVRFDQVDASGRESSHSLFVAVK